MVCSHEPTLSSELLDPALDSFKFCCICYPQAYLSHRDEGRRVMETLLLGCHSSWWLGDVTGWTTGWTRMDHRLGHAGCESLEELCCPDTEQTGVVTQRWPEHAMVEHQK